MTELNLNASGNEKQKRFKFRANMVIFALVLVATAIFMFVTSSPAVGVEATLDEMEKEGTYYEYRMDLKVKVYVMADGTVIFKGRVVKDLSRLSKLVSNELAGKIRIKNRPRVALIADQRVEYGVITNVLRQLRKAKIGSVFMTYQGHVSLLQAMQEINTRKAQKDG